MDRKQDTEITTEERRALLERHGRLVVGWGAALCVLLLAFPLVLIVIDQPIGIAFPVGMVLIVGAFLAYRQWIRRTVAAMRAQDPSE